MWKPVSAAIVNERLLSHGTETGPLGVIVPPPPADAVIVWTRGPNVAAIVCAAVTFVNV